MRFCPRSAVACVCFALAFSPSSHSQATPPANRHGQFPSPPEPNLRGYNDFIQTIGREDDRIQREALDGKTQTVDRTYYPAGIPLNADEEQRTLSTILDAYRKHKEVYWSPECRLPENKIVLVSRYGADKAMQMIQSSQETCLGEELPIAQEAWLELKNELGEQSFRWLNAWVGQGRYVKVGPREPNPCPPNYDPPAGQTTHLACGGFYEHFFEDFGRVEAHNRKMVEEGTPEEQELFKTRIHLAEDKKQAVIALGIEASRVISENDLQCTTQTEDFISRNNLQRDAKTGEYPLPPEIEALWTKHAVLVEGYIFKLKRILGDELFKQFDTQLSAQNHGIMKPAPTPVRPNNPAAKQIPEVQR